MPVPDLVGFGVNALAGEHLVSAVSPTAVAETALAVETSRESELHTRPLQSVAEVERGWDVDLRSLAEAGWGVIFAADEDPAVREAMGKRIRTACETMTGHAVMAQQATRYETGTYPPLARSGAVAALVGAVLFFLSGLLHPSTSAPTTSPPPLPNTRGAHSGWRFI